MKVLLVNTSDHIGGAAIAALRLLKALRGQGVEARLLCRDRTLPDDRTDVVSLRPSKWRRLQFFLERLEIYWRNGCSRENLFAVDTGRFGTDITRLAEFQEADVIHLHWVNQAMLSLKDLRKIFKSGKPVVWTMHDMWPFTGVCHSAADCEAWLHGCGDCPQLLKSGPADLSAQTFVRKRDMYAGAHLTLVGCSRWLASLASKAPLLSEQRVACVPNPIDTDYYRPAGDHGMPSKAEVRRQLGLPTDRKLMLFAAFKVTDPNKGIDYLMEALSILTRENPELRDQLGVVLAGQGAWTLREALPLSAYPMGYVTSEDRMRLLYQAADLLLMPTQMDNLPNTIVEAMACGVPCVAFGVGGVPQMVDTGVNGYLAIPRDSADFAKGIHAALFTQSYDALCRNARVKAVASYSEKEVASQYMHLYEEALGNQPLPA